MNDHTNPMRRNELERWDPRPAAEPSIERSELNLLGDEPLAWVAAEFFRNNYLECRETLLQKTRRIRLLPETSPYPQRFRFEIDTAYKRKLSDETPVELADGPLTGEVIYRGDMFLNPQGPCLVVMIDRELGFFHPNYSRRFGYLCIGDAREFPPGPIPLAALLENQIYPIVTYQNRRPSSPADLEAARYFALDPTAMDGLEPAIPWY